MDPIDEITMDVVANRTASQELTRESRLTAFDAMQAFVDSLRTNFLVPLLIESRPIRRKKWPWDNPPTLPVRWVGIWIARPSLEKSLKQYKNTCVPYEVFSQLNPIWAITIYEDKLQLSATITILNTERQGFTNYTKEPGYGCQWDPIAEQWTKVKRLEKVFFTKADGQLKVDQQSRSCDPSPLMRNDVMHPAAQFIQWATAPERQDYIHWWTRGKCLET